MQSVATWLAVQLDYKVMILHYDRPPAHGADHNIGHLHLAEPP